MNKSATTKVIEKLIDLELIFQLRADLSRYKKRKHQSSLKVRSSEAA
ncbi:MAG: hypothetical protein ACO1N7_05020 [Sphingobacteriaceae bacterium]